jgi:hypothetical protein
VTNTDDRPVLTDEIRAWIGRESPEETAEVTQREIERYALPSGTASCAMCPPEGRYGSPDPVATALRLLMGVAARN